MPKNEKSLPICLVPGCGRTCGKGNHARGMCSRCYAEARRMVMLKEITWLELQNLGFAIVPERKIKPKESTPLFVAVQSARKAGATPQEERNHE